MKPQWLAGIVLVTILSICAAFGYITHLQNQRDDALAAKRQAGLEAEGFKKALVAKPQEVIKLVPTLVTNFVTKGVKEGSIKPIAAAAISANTSLYVPCPTSEPDLGSLEPNLGTDVHLTFTANLLITRIRFGEAVSWKGDVGGTSQFGSAEPSPLTFAPEDTHINVLVADDIAVALRQHEREGGWFKRHTGLVCPGGGVAYDLQTGKLIPTVVSCTYGFTWF